MKVSDPRAKVKKEYGERLLSLRLKSELTQEQLAKKVKVSYQTISNAERGFTIPQPMLRDKLARFFGTDDLLQKPVDPKPVPSDKFASLRTEIEHFDVIRPAPDVHIFVNPDLPLEQKQIVQELGMELRRRLMEKKRN